jgi:glycosyltransferase involved in cell wall biosynthesis
LLHRLADAGLLVVAPMYRGSEGALGRDEMGGAAERMAHERGISSHVRFAGFRRDVPELLSLCDLMLLPSRWEGLPFSILEAMAMGTPVVATAVGGVSEIVKHGETGVLLAAAEPKAIAGAIVSLLSDRATLERMGRKAAEVVRRDFSCEEFVGRMEAIYERLLTGGLAGAAGGAVPAEESEYEERAAA